MWGRREFSLFSIYIISCVIFADAEVRLVIDNVSQVAGVKGQHLSIKCPYKDDFRDKHKQTFFCKGNKTDDCETSGVKVSSRSNRNGRFSLSDDASAGVFTVNITGLREEDSGIYRCGVEGQVYNKWISVINLEVSEETKAEPTTTASYYTASNTAVKSSSSSSTPSRSSSFPYSLFQGFTTIIILLIMGMLIVFGFSAYIYFIWRQKKEGMQCRGDVHGSSGNLPHEESWKTREVTHTACDDEDIHYTHDNSENTLMSPVFGEQDSSIYALAQLPSSP